MSYFDDSADAAEHTEPVLHGPIFDSDALVFELRPEIAGLAAEDFAAVAESTELRELRDYVARYGPEGAALTSLYPERAQSVREEENWQLAAPGPEPAGPQLSGMHHLRLASAEHGARLKDALSRSRGVVDVGHPVIQYPLDAPPSAAGPPLAALWWLQRCGFAAGLDEGPDPGPIAIIDQGRNAGHPELAGRIVKEAGPSSGSPSKSIHAGAVAGVIAALQDGKDVDGCCAAKLHLYNVWSTRKFDSLAYYMALKEVAAEDSPVRVLNLSMGSTVSDRRVEQLVQECIARGVTVVAAMGDLAGDGHTPVFPAAYPGVIAVGASDRSDARLASSSTGEHIWLSAPGEQILTLLGNDGFRERSGTSYAAAMVSAAAWLALRARPCLAPGQVRDLLSRSVAGNGKHTRELGHGRLDIPAMAAALEKIPAC